MKLLLIVALAILASAHAAEQPEHNYIFFPDGDGVPHLIDLNEKYVESEADIKRNLDSITFNLFTKRNPLKRQVLNLNEIKTVTNSNFLRTRPTRFFTHGWLSNQTSTACVVIRDAYLAVGDYNVIVVDWGEIASAPYTIAANNVKHAAGRISEFINFLNRQAGLKLASTMIVGHSLGGHVAGIAAHGVSGTLQGVVSLDPALPLFYTAGPGRGVHPDDAAHVQVIHTNGGMLGLMRPAGNSDFYPNGGRRQPGCQIDVAGLCSHIRAYYLFAESILNTTGFRSREDSSVFMGGRTLTSAHGRFTLKTASSPPFALG